MKLLKKIISLGAKLLGASNKNSSKKKSLSKSKSSRKYASDRGGEHSKRISHKDARRTSGSGKGFGGASSKNSHASGKYASGSSAEKSQHSSGRGGRDESRSGGGHSSRRSGYSSDNASSKGSRSGSGSRGRSRESGYSDLQNISVKIRQRKDSSLLEIKKSLEELKESVAEFAELGLNQKVLAAVEDMGYISPTPIQKQAIPELLKGSDIIGTAQTGTGKTAAFALPLVQMLDADEDNFGVARVLVLSPTRELATQTAEAFKNFSKYVDVDVALIQGGVSMRPQVEAIKSGAEVLVATPGRLLDFIRQGIMSLKSVKYLVLDEVDRMFDMGFIEDVSNIIRYCPKERQTLFFSATMPDAVMRLSEWALQNPVFLENGIGMPAETIEHYVYPVDSIQKYDMLIEFLKTIKFESLIVFTRTRMDADRISEWLLGHDYKVSTLHSDKSQNERDRALQDFKYGKTSILVATDIASRGLDISNVSYVINYNVPEHAEDYVHRIGRTGRANKDGTAVTFFASEESEFLRRIEALINGRIERRKLDAFAYRNEPIIDETPKRAKRRNK